MRRLQCLLSGQHSCPRHVPCHGRQMCHLPAEGAPGGLDAPLPAPAHSLWSPPGHVPWGRATAMSHCRPLRPCPAMSPGSWPAPAPGCSLLLRLRPGPAPSARVPCALGLWPHPSGLRLLQWRLGARSPTVTRRSVWEGRHLGSQMPSRTPPAPTLPPPAPRPWGPGWPSRHPPPAQGANVCL